MSYVLNGSELAEESPRRQPPVLARLTKKVDTSTNDHLQNFLDRQAENLVAGIGNIHSAQKSTRVKLKTSGEEDCWIGCGYLPTNTVLLRYVV